MNFIITIDTEGDNQWDHGCALTVNNIRFIPRFQALCTKYSIKPTYLVTTEVCGDGFAKEIFSEFLSTNQAEVGAHLHSWTTPPFLDKVGYKFNDNNHPFASEIATEILAEKIKTLTIQIETSFGKRPISFRSGRYGFNENVAQILVENNYKVDSSVTPYTSWITNKGLPGGKGGPDFIHKTPTPYNYYFENKSLLEIPITILPTKFPLNKYPLLANYYFRNSNEMRWLKVLRKVYFKKQPLWLRPYEWMSRKLFNEIVEEAIRIKLPFLVMMFHSSELMAGCSIYRKDESSIERLYLQLEDLFILLNDRKIKAVTLSEAALNYKL